MFYFMDFKYAIRQLFKAPKFTALTLLVLLGGLTLSLFTFSFLYTVMYKPLPVPEGETAMALRIKHDGRTVSVPAFEYLSIRDDIQSLSEQGIFEEGELRIGVGEKVFSTIGSFVEQNLFSFSRTEPVLGRVFQSEDYEKIAPPVVVIGYEFWQQHFLLDQEVLNKTIRINHNTYTIIGVMPQGYEFPTNSQIWLPLPLEKLIPNIEEQNYLRVYARINPEVSQAAAEQEITQLIQPLYETKTALAREHNQKISAVLIPYHENMSGDEGPILFYFFNVIAFAILMLAAVNVGNLLLARAVERSKEIAIRAALGASEGRLITQVMYEGALITITGTVLSILLAAALLDYTNIVTDSWLPHGIVFWWRWGMDLPTLLMAGAYCFTLLVLTCFLPGWRATRQDINATLRDGTRGAQGKKLGKASKILVIAQIFIISLLMMIGSVSAYLSSYLMNLDFGETYVDVIKVDLDLPKKQYDTSEKEIAFYQQFKDHLINQPEISQVMVRGYLSDAELIGHELELEQSFSGDKSRINAVSMLGETDILGIKLLSGRQLDQRDHGKARFTVLISQSMAERYWPGESVIEKNIRLKIDGIQHTFTIVGVVENKVNGTSVFADKGFEDEVYVSALQLSGGYKNIFFKKTVATEMAFEAIYNALFFFDQAIEVREINDASKVMDMMRGMMRLTANLTYGCGAFALMLALTGIYGLTRNSIAQKTHEIGIRRALGASDRAIIALFLRQSLSQVFVGMAISVSLFGVIAFVFHGFTLGVIPWSLYVILAALVSVGLTLIVLCAVYLPTRYAVRLEPAHAIRFE